MIRRIVQIITCIIIIFLSANIASSNPFGLDGSIGFPVKITLSDGSTGTGFYLNDEPFTYLVTAKHVLFKTDSPHPRAKKAELVSYGRNSKDLSPNIIQLDLAAMFAAKNLRSHQTQDVAIARIAKTVTKNETKLLKLYNWAQSINWASTGIMRFDTKETVKKISNVTILNDVVVYGYPSLIGIKYFPQRNYDRPLLRKGIIAGINHKAGSIIIDAAVNHGYRGGPVIEIGQNPLNANPTLIGILGGQLPYAEDRLNSQSKNSNPESLNSGFGVVIPVNSILEILWE